MKITKSLFGLIACAAFIFGMHHPIFAKHSSSSSSSSSSNDSCCERGKKLLEEIKYVTGQDLIVDNQTNLLAQNIDYIVRTDLEIDQEILSILQTQTDCVNYITSLPYNITDSGYYRLVCDLTFSPSSDAQNAITVAPNVVDVDLDFANFTMSMDPNSTTHDNNGILINSGCQNIVVHDGTIHGFSASQIRGYTSLNTIEVRNMILQGIPGPGGSRMINETVASGVNLGAVVEDIGATTPAQNTTSSNIKLSNLMISGIFLDNLSIADQAAWGVGLFYCNDIAIDRVYVSQLTNKGLVVNKTGQCTGFGFLFCTNSISRFCVANDLLSQTPNNGTNVTGDAIGTIYSFSDRVENYDCSYSNNVGTRRCGGIVWKSTSDFVAERCVADSNRIVNTTASGIASHYGFEAVGNIPPVATPFCNRGNINDCHVLNQPTCFFANGATDVIYENCTAIAGNLTAQSTILTFGFETAGSSDGITFKNCIATGFVVPNPTTQGGFRIVASTNVNILDCKSTKNSIGIFVASSSNHIVADSNEVAFNTEFGIQDATATQTPNLYTRNIAFANATNYSINTTNPNFKIVQSSQSAAFPLYTAANASPLSNFDLQP